MGGTLARAARCWKQPSWPASRGRRRCAAGGSVGRPGRCLPDRRPTGRPGRRPVGQSQPDAGQRDQAFRSGRSQATGRPGAEIEEVYDAGVAVDRPLEPRGRPSPGRRRGHGSLPRSPAPCHAAATWRRCTSSSTARTGAASGSSHLMAYRRAGARVTALAAEPRRVEHQRRRRLNPHRPADQTRRRPRARIWALPTTAMPTAALAVDANRRRSSTVTRSRDVRAGVAIGRASCERARLLATVMSNLGLHLAMQKAGVRVVTTAVGDRYVLDGAGRTGSVPRRRAESDTSSSWTRRRPATGCSPLFG